MKLIIGLTGNKGSGKSTTFGLIQELVSEAKEITLADRLKQASAKAFNIPRAAFDDPKVKEKDLESPVCFNEENTKIIIEYFKVPYDFEKHVKPHIGKILRTPRQIAQYVGTEVLRNIDTEIHCKGSVLDLPEKGLFTVTDIRFPNEFDFFKSLPETKFYPCYVSNRTAEAIAGNDPHISEKYIPELARKSRVLDNNGSFSDLKRQLVVELALVLLLR